MNITIPDQFCDCCGYANCTCPPPDVLLSATNKMIDVEALKEFIVKLQSSRNEDLKRAYKFHFLCHECGETTPNHKAIERELQTLQSILDWIQKETK